MGDAGAMVQEQCAQGERSRVGLGCEATKGNFGQWGGGGSPGRLRHQGNGWGVQGGSGGQGVLVGRQQGLGEMQVVDGEATGAMGGWMKRQREKEHQNTS